MKKSPWIPITIGVVALAGVGYFLYKRFVAKKEDKIKSIKDEGKTDTETVTLDVITTNPVITGNPLLDIGNTLSSYLQNFNDYKINTQSSNLNVREKPDGSSKIIGSLKKGAVVKAKVSGTKGWFAISDDGKTVKGYVSQSYLVAMPKK